MRSYAFRAMRSLVDGQETAIHVRVDDPDRWKIGSFQAIFPGDPCVLDDPRCVLYLQERVDEAMAAAIP